MLVGEVAVRRRDVDARLGGDVVQRDRQSTCGKQSQRGVDEGLPVAGGVRAQPARLLSHGHSGHRQACTATVSMPSFAERSATPGLSSAPTTTAATAKIAAQIQNATT